ncbi:uncharacterized protein CPUR_08771 [Claviceps purpurea 20.1]|uniref:Uncharacterized protein n=1 Tax=Claviceps purpurea (strain 20.1) TaxID=1111077 RepID=M1VZC9_CLAP2|nr:uncharacterized protein CPUR_08771 [Claviceps purpurea 20.1]
MVHHYAITPVKMGSPKGPSCVGSNAEHSTTRSLLMDLDIELRLWTVEERTVEES